MSDTLESLPAPTISARNRIAALAAAIPQIKNDVELLQREIIELAPDCEAGNAAARDRRKKLRAKLGDLSDAIADKKAAIVALQPEAIAEQDQMKAEALLARAAHAESAFLARDEASKKVDEALRALIDTAHHCTALGGTAIKLCHDLLPENRIGWVTPPQLGNIIISALGYGGVIGPEFLLGGDNIGRVSIEKIMISDSTALIGAIREATAVAAMSTEKRKAADKQRLEIEAANLARIDREREANGVRSW